MNPVHKRADDEASRGENMGEKIGKKVLCSDLAASKILAAADRRSYTRKRRINLGIRQEPASGAFTANSDVRTGLGASRVLVASERDPGLSGYKS